MGFCSSEQTGLKGDDTVFLPLPNKVRVHHSAALSLFPASHRWGEKEGSHLQISRKSKGKSTQVPEVDVVVFGQTRSCCATPSPLPLTLPPASQRSWLFSINNGPLTLLTYLALGLPRSPACSHPQEGLLQTVEKVSPTEMSGLNQEQDSLPASRPSAVVSMTDTKTFCFNQIFVLPEACVGGWVCRGAQEGWGVEPRTPRKINSSL